MDIECQHFTSDYFRPQIWWYFRVVTIDLLVNELMVKSCIILRDNFLNTGWNMFPFTEGFITFLEQCKAYFSTIYIFIMLPEMRKTQKCPYIYKYFIKFPCASWTTISPNSHQQIKARYRPPLQVLTSIWDLSILDRPMLEIFRSKKLQYIWLENLTIRFLSNIYFGLLFSKIR